MLTITDVVTKLIQFNKTERPVVVTLYTRDQYGCVLEEKEFKVEAVFSHRDDTAEIIIFERN